MVQAATIKQFVRVVNVIAAIAIIALPAISIVYVVLDAIESLRFFLIFSPFFMITFGILMLAAEFKVKFIIRKVSFLKSLLGKGVFSLYLSSIVYYFFAIQNQNTLAWAGAIIMLVLAIFYFAMYFAFKCGKKQESQVPEQQNPNVQDTAKPYKQRLM